jgi:hypothetical protein
VKPLDRWSRRQRHGAPLPSWGHRRGALFPADSLRCRRWQVLVLLVLFCLSLICCVKGFFLVILYRFSRVALFIKRGKSVFRGKMFSGLKAKVVTSYLGLKLMFLRERSSLCFLLNKNGYIGSEFGT